MPRTTRGAPRTRSRRSTNTATRPARATTTSSTTPRRTRSTTPIPFHPPRGSARPPRESPRASPISSSSTSSFAGYHSLSNLGHGVTIYANIPDPLIEAVVPPGADPQGNPDAEQAIDVAGHELVESITDPVGTGWMDPNGNEVADKCEIGPQHGTPLGYAPDGSPYNQLINGHQYLLQMMWDNKASGCVQHTSVTTSALPLAQVRMSQFHTRISGNTGIARAGVRVEVSLVRTGTEVASATART